MGAFRASADFIERHNADEEMASIWTDGIYNGISFIGSSVANGDGDGNADGDIDTPTGNAWGLRPKVYVEQTRYNSFGGSPP